MLVPGTLKLITAPTVEPLDLGEMKTHLRVDTSDDDALIVGLIQTARERAEDVTGRALCTQTWELVMDAFPQGDTLWLPRPPLQSVTSIKYKVDGATEYTFAASNYVVDADGTPGRVVLEDGASWPGDTLYEAAAVRARYVAGYGDAEDVPMSVRQAMLLMVGHWYENREETVGVGNVQAIPLGARALLMPYRMWWW